MDVGSDMSLVQLQSMEKAMGNIDFGDLKQWDSPGSVNTGLDDEELEL